MKKDPLYFTLFILTILFCSSFYLSWATDRGLGEITVERFTIEKEPGHPVDFLVYAPRVGAHLDPMPLALTIHGLAGSKEGMYAFNIELARRNFTVVSIDLPGHGDSVLPFDITDFHGMAEDAYAALRYVQNNWDNVDNESYGVLTHSLGFRVGIELMDFPVAPKAYAAVGDVGQMSLGSYVNFPGNLLIAVGEYDEMISPQDAIDALRTATGNESAVAGVTYGSLANQTAYRLAFAPTDHVFEAIDGTIVRESTSWLIQGVQGEDQLVSTLDPAQQIYFNKTIAMTTGVLFLLVSVLPLIALIYKLLPEKMKPRKISNVTTTFSLRKTFLISSVLGALMVTIYSLTSVAGFYLEDNGLAWPSSMFATGLVLFYIGSTVILTITMFLLMGKIATISSFNSVGIERISIKEHFVDILKGLFIAVVCIAWLLFWLAICGLPEQMQPWIALALVKWPVNVRGINTVLVMVIMIPYLVVDAAWLRGLLLSERNWGDRPSKIKTTLFAFASKFAVTTVLAVVVVFGSTALGFIAGKMVLMGLLLLLMLIVSILTTVLTALTAFEFENTWPAIILSAFMLSLVFVASIPLI